MKHVLMELDLKSEMTWSTKDITRDLEFQSDLDTVGETSFCV